LLRFQFIANRHHRETAKRGVIRRFAIDENRIEIGGLAGFLSGTDLAALGALGPAELDLAQPDEDVGFAFLGGFPNGREKNGPAFGAGTLQFDVVNLDHHCDRHFQDRGDVIIIQTQAGVLHDGFEFDFGDGFQIGLRGLVRCGHDATRVQPVRRNFTSAARGDGGGLGAKSRCG
jgi:hypothetical protein